MNKQVAFRESSSDVSRIEPYIVFNFYETILPAPGFDSFQDGFMHVSKVIRKHDQFLYGLLLKEINDTGRFPYLSYNVYGTTKLNPFRHDPSILKVIREGHGTEQVHHQAGFEEYETIFLKDEPEERHNRRVMEKNTLFLVTLFKADGDLDRLEKSWRSWSGAEFVLQGMPQELKDCLRRVTFHRRVVPKGSFMYILLCEFRDVKSVIYRIRDFTNKMNERQCGYCSAFEILEEIFPLEKF